MYELRLNDEVITVPYLVWEQVRQYVRENKWFYIVHDDQVYRYVKDQAYYNRPTRFEFKIVEPGTEGSFEFIYIDDNQEIEK